MLQKYCGLSMQEKICIIAQVFNCKAGEIRTSPCHGKWRGTSDISIRFDNGNELFIGNCQTKKAKTKAAQSELVDRTLGLYNPERIQENKALAFSVLKVRGQKDNAVAAEKGLQPYTLLDIGFNDGNTPGCSIYLGWYYAVLKIGETLRIHLETGLRYDIMDRRTSPEFDRDVYYTAGGLQDDEVDYVFNNVGFSSKSGLYTLNVNPEEFLQGKVSRNEGGMAI